MLTSIGLPELIIILPFLVVGVAVVLVPLCFITKRAGYTPWWGLVNVLPFGALVWLYWMAFAEWPLGKNRTGEPSPMV